MTINVQAFDPLWVNSGERLVDDQINWVNYSHEIKANGGFWLATFSILVDEFAASDWIYNGIGRHIEVKGPALQTVWEGFVNELSVNVGDKNISIGPMLEVSNKVSVMYQTVTYNTNPPIGGERVQTEFFDNSDSQDRYGVLQAVLNGGTGTATEMAQLIQTFLAEMANPPRNESISIGQGESFIISVTCVGYYRLAEKLIYENTSTGTQNLSDKINAIWAASPTVAFDTGNVDSNTTTVGTQETDSRTYKQLFDDLIARGDASFNRYIMGVYTGREVFYNAIPSQLEYHFLLGDSRKDVTTPAGLIVEYWDVQPGKWIYNPDFLPGYDAPSNLETVAELRANLRCMFIESVKFTAPHGLVLTGGETGSLAQLLARIDN